MLTFYGNLFLLAMRAIPGSLGSNWLGLIWPAVVVTVGEIIACFTYGWRKMIEKWKQATLIGLASLGVCYLLLFTYCAIRTNYDVYASVNSTNETYKSLLNSASERQRYAVLEAQSECAKETGKNETLGEQNRDQQNTINNCQTQALKLLTPQEPKLSALQLDNEPSGAETRTRILLLTNRTVTPIQGRVICDKVLTNANALIVGASTQSGGSSIKPPNVLNIEIDSPAFTTTTPMIVSLFYLGSGPINCNFDIR